MAFKLYETRPNTIEHNQTRSNSTKQGVQTVKYLVTKQCLMVFGRQTFIVCPGPKALAKREMFGDQTPSNMV